VMVTGINKSLDGAPGAVKIAALEYLTSHTRIRLLAPLLSASPSVARALLGHALPLCGDRVLVSLSLSLALALSRSLSLSLSLTLSLPPSLSLSRACVCALSRSLLFALSLSCSRARACVHAFSFFLICSLAAPTLRRTSCALVYTVQSRMRVCATVRERGGGVWSGGAATYTHSTKYCAHTLSSLY